MSTGGGWSGWDSMSTKEILAELRQYHEMFRNNSGRFEKEPVPDDGEVEGWDE